MGRSTGVLYIFWVLAVCGIVLQLWTGLRYGRFSLALYLGMGWLTVVAGWPFCTHVPWPGLVWLLAGGIAYTVAV